MTVHFIGAGPGAADLITVRGRDLIARCPVCLYAGSIVPEALLAHCPPGARIVDTAPMSLDEIEAEFVARHAAGRDVARLHSGDLSIYSALAEQLRRLDAARHSLHADAGRAGLRCRRRRARARADCARGGAKRGAHPHARPRLAHARGRDSSRRSRRPARRWRSISPFHAIEAIVAELTPFYGADCPAAVVVRASWPRGADPARHAGRHRRQGRRRADRAHRARCWSAGRSPQKVSATARCTTRIIGAGFAVEKPDDRRRRRAWPTNWPSRSNTAISTATPLPATGPSAVSRAVSRDLVAERDARRGGMGEGFRRGVRCGDARAQRGGAAGGFRQSGQRRQIDGAALGMQVEHALRELRHLGDAAGDGHPRHRMAAQVFEHAADEIAHFDQRGLGQSAELLHGGFRTRRRSSRRYG